MDGSRVDALARNLAGRRSRRALLAALATLGLADQNLPLEARTGGRKRRPKRPCLAPTASLQASIEDAAPGATIRLCAGAYPGSLSIDKDLTLRGAGAGRTTLLGGNAQRVVRVTDGGQTVVLSGLTIAGGGDGGIINGATLTLVGCVVRGNRSSAGAGAYNQSDGRLTLDATVVAGNAAENGAGGGIYNAGSLVVRNGSRIGGTRLEDGNRAQFGGGLYNAAGSARFAKGTRLTGNTADDQARGGGVYNAVADGVTLATARIVTGNTVNGAPNNCRGPEPVAKCLPDA